MEAGSLRWKVRSVLAQKGIETTMVLPEDRIWKRFFRPTMSQFFETYYAERGVRFAKNTKVMELKGAGAVKSAVLQMARFWIAIWS